MELFQTTSANGPFKCLDWQMQMVFSIHLFVFASSFVYFRYETCIITKSKFMGSSSCWELTYTVSRQKNDWSKTRTLKARIFHSRAYWFQLSGDCKHSLASLLVQNDSELISFSCWWFIRRSDECTLQVKMPFLRAPWIKHLL